LLQDAASGKTTFLPYRDFTVEIVPSDKSIPFSLTAWIDLPSIKEIEKREPAGIITLEQPTKENLVGVQVNAKASGKNSFSWAGFQWYKIRMSALWIEPADTVIGVGEELELVARHNGTAPAGTRFEWDFGDGKTASHTGDSTATHVWEEQGEFDVTVTMYPPGSSEPTGTAVATVNASLFPTMMVTLMGMSTTPPSTIKATDGSDIPSIVWANKTGGAPPLTWKGKEFSVEHSFSVSGVDVNYRISGRISDDSKSIATLTAINSGVGLGGAYSYTFSIVLTDFPVAAYPGGPLNGELRGPAAQAKVSNLAWRQSSVDNQGNTNVVELASVDWSSQQTQLSVYFYR
ncbi:MAG: PKD domain-containing protein, partial [Bacteroidetes bacterium]|nr:PKD domain-containing protein [Bacteroidota bacterium]